MTKYKFKCIKCGKWFGSDEYRQFCAPECADVYHRQQPIVPSSTCAVLRQHKQVVGDDPERLHTDFIARMSGFSRKSKITRITSTCIMCGKPFDAPHKKLRCDECKKIHRREYQRKYYRKYYANATNIG